MWGGADDGKYWAAGQVVRLKERIGMPGEEETLLEESSLEETLGEKSLQHILQSMLQSIENSKGQIFDIYEEAKNEVEISKRNLAEVKRQANEVIDEVDALEAEEQKEKQRLVRESSRFTDYSETKIQQAYEAVKNDPGTVGHCAGKGASASPAAQSNGTSPAAFAADGGGGGAFGHADQLHAELLRIPDQRRGGPDGRSIQEPLFEYQLPDRKSVV